HYSKPHEDLSKFQQFIPMEPEELKLKDLIGAFSVILKRKEWLNPAPSTVDLEEITINERIEWLEDRIQNSNQEIPFSLLFKKPTRREYVVTFLALLEMMKDNKIHIKQADSFGEILLSRS
ncbi:MAG: segregation/condensation protein A, partial [Alkalibacterium sp.]|nr:segregation/condensation protein A [Alkalibacterium sp.]